MQLQPFHLAIPVHDLAEARHFYGTLLGCPEGRSAPEWVDFDFFGHQLVAHLDTHGGERRPVYNPVDGKDVPVPHFGVVLEWNQWHELAERLRQAGVRFGIEPGIRFQGQVGEQATLFSRIPAGTPWSSRRSRIPRGCSRSSSAELHAAAEPPGPWRGLSRTGASQGGALASGKAANSQQEDPGWSRGFDSRLRFWRPASWP